MGWFGGSSDNAAEVPKEQPEKSKKKICCACPDTKVWQVAIQFALQYSDAVQSLLVMLIRPEYFSMT